MDFAKVLIGDHDIDDVGGDCAPHDHAPSVQHSQQHFHLKTMSNLWPEVINAGLEAYFDRFDWFVQLLHEPTFAARAYEILQTSTWAEEELCEVILVLMVAALGFQCASNDGSWYGHQLLKPLNVNAMSMVKSLLTEVGVHFYQVLTQSRIEAYQTVMLLNIYHVYFGSLNFAQHISGIPAQCAHKLGLHRDDVSTLDHISYQVGIRCWNHAVVGELFASMIYGKPTSLDPSFARFRHMTDLQDQNFPPLTAGLTILKDSSVPLSPLKFHVLKFELYGVIKDHLQATKALELGPRITVHNLTLLVQAVKLAEAKLAKWRSELPPVFDPSHWTGSDPWDDLLVDDLACTAKDRSCRRNLALQGVVLQVLHDSAIIMSHRPLLQCRISNSSDLTSALQDIPDSLGVSAAAALRISRIPIGRFEHHLALSFTFMHLFTAGVILCVPPTCLPYSQLASDSKSGVLRIISASRALERTNSIARYTNQLLTKLYQKTIQHEMESALRNADPETFALASHRRPNNVLPVAWTETSTARRGTNSNVSPSLQVSPAESEYDATLVPESCDAADLEGEKQLGLDMSTLDASAQPAFSYALFDSAQRETFVPYINDHLEEAFGAFDQSTSCLSLGDP